MVKVKPLFQKNITFCNFQFDSQGPVQSIISLTKSSVEDSLSLTVLTKFVAAVFFAENL